MLTGQRKNQQPTRTRHPLSSPTPPCLRIRIRSYRWWRKRRMSQSKIGQPSWTWEVPTTRKQRINCRHHFYSFCHWYLCGQARLAVGHQTQPLYWLFPRTWHTFPCEHYFPSPLYRAAEFPRPFHPSLRCHYKLWVWWSYFNFIDMMINDSIWSTMVSDLTLLLFFFISNYPIRGNICQGINYQWINTIKREQTFGKLSIRN